MANQPLILSDNYYDDVILHPNHIVVPNGTQVVGSEYWHIADHLRDITRWTNANPGSGADMVVDTTASKSADTIILDRGHNLGGIGISVQGSNTSTTGPWTTITSATIPTTAGGLNTDSNGCLTPDGVWWKYFSLATWRYFRFGWNGITGSNAIITGLYLGPALRMTDFLDGPASLDYRRRVDVNKNVVSRGGVRVKREIQVFSEIDLKCTGMDEANFQTLRPHVDRLLYNTHPWWVCPDDSTTEGSGLLRFFQLPGPQTYDPVVDPIQRNIALLLEEVIPTLIL